MSSPLLLSRRPRPWAALSVLAVLAFVTPAAGQIVLAPGAPVAAHSSAFDPLVGDFDLDRRVDLLLINSLFGDGVTFFGDGQGGFANSVDAGDFGSTLLGSRQMADVDADGRLDVVVQDLFAGDDVEAYLGDGDGTFGFSVASPALQVVGFLRDVRRMDADPFPDLIFMSFSEEPRVSRLQVAAGQGDGTFALAVTRRLPAAPLDVASGDVNEDGHVDLLTLHESGAVRTWLGPRLTPGPATDLPPGGSTFLLADIDGDGHLDLASGGLTTRLGRGDGTFGGAREQVLELGPGRLIAADFDQDGRLDLAVYRIEFVPLATELGDVELLRNVGGGQFTSDGVLPTGVASGVPVVLDANRDRYPDLVWTNFQLEFSTSVVRLALNQSPGSGR